MFVTLIEPNCKITFVLDSTVYFNRIFSYMIQILSPKAIAQYKWNSFFVYIAYWTAETNFKQFFFRQVQVNDFPRDFWPESELDWANELGLIENDPKEFHIETFIVHQDLIHDDLVRDHRCLTIHINQIQLEWTFKIRTLENNFANRLCEKCLKSKLYLRSLNLQL